MQKQDAEKFKSIIKGLAFNAGITEVPKEIMRFYIEALKSFSIEQIDSASKIILKTWEYPKIPPVAVFIKAIEKSQGAISNESKAEIECDKIISHLKQYGASILPVFDDPITKHIMTRLYPYGQWASQVLMSELTWFMKDFKKLYLAHEEMESVDMIEDINGGVKKLLGGIGGDDE